MPVTPTYPGVYIQEAPSGSRSIAAVGTSIGAFIGKATFGPLNRAVRCLNWGDFERAFGGLDADSEMSYAVRQFFLNGGTQCHAIRVAKNPSRATATLQNEAAADVLKIDAADEGRGGNEIVREIDHETGNPASTFNFRLTFNPPSGGATVVETFTELSMNSNDQRYVEDMVNEVSKLVTVERVVDVSGAPQGTSTSGDLSGVASLVDATHNQIRVVVNGLVPVPVAIDVAAVAAAGTENAKLNSIASQTQIQLQAADTGGVEPAWGSATAARVNKTIVITSGQGGENSTVRVLPGIQNNAAAQLKLGTENGGIEKDGVADFRPRPRPLPGIVEGGVLTNALIDGATAPHSLSVALDGASAAEVTLSALPPTAATVGERVTALADAIQDRVRQLKPSFPAYQGFVCRKAASSNRLEFVSGTTGSGSSVQITAVSGSDLVAQLQLEPADVSVADGADEHLAGGWAEDYSEAETYAVMAGSRSDRTGLYALEDAEFNILTLPGVSDPGMIADAASYCEERRAFLIIDPPRTTSSPADMEALISGPDLPRSDHAAVYWPWIDSADPLKPGKTRQVPPSGTIAGLYARTDGDRGVWKAPAGIEASLNNAQGLAYSLTDQENGLLNPLGGNCIRFFPGTGIIAWGARTMRGADHLADDYKYVPVRRLALFIEESLYRGLQWVVFEPNGESLWSEIRLAVGGFMQGLFRQGAFAGTKPADAFFVKCDSETTTQTDRNLGIVNINVGFAPLKPAEFVILTLQQMAGQAES